MIAETYKLTDVLRTGGFNIDRLENIIERNNGNLEYNTQFFIIGIVPKKTEIFIENQRYVIEPEHLIFIRPSKKIRFSENYKNSEMVVLVFTASFYERTPNDALILNSEIFFSTSSDVFIAPSIGDVKDIQKLIIGRLNLYKNKKKGLYLSVAHNCVEILLLDGLLVLEENMGGSKSVRFEYIDIVNRFRVLLSKNFESNKSVSFYADFLGVTSKKLSKATEIVLGKTAKRVITEKVLNESEKLLKYSNLTVSEVAFKLGFFDEGNFSAFIKKQTKKTPTEIREILHF